MPATKQQIRQIIADNNLNSVADVMSTAFLGTASKISFRNLWRRNWMLPLVMKRTRKAMSPHPIKETDTRLKQ